MQYLMGMFWVVYIIHALRRAYAEHWTAWRIRNDWRRLALVEPGMECEDVRLILGGPDRVNAGPDQLIWTYRVGGEFKRVTFTGGAVSACDRPPAPQTGEPQGLRPSGVAAL